MACVTPPPNSQWHSAHSNLILQRVQRPSHKGVAGAGWPSSLLVPPYAILSHTWGAGTDEVTSKDLTNGIGEGKPGYEKIRFCGDQAWRDGLQYFWIDTCSIGKANKGEFSPAINSMFPRYRNSTRCYAYLSDVSSSPSPLDANEEFNPSWWELDFRTSRWATRGWTLQEVLAPSLVEFFSWQHKRLGDVRSLTLQIYEIIGIPK
ncbi:HET-domain-containing protein [Amniculicola lignicola CBS 123094]|uniref:HET-domain-containing protein n=1 Tax=Amniculicola lignicola CBS 123094 TaxID=1392246 RepID=A0A6A5X3R8_9PLEO|nr:HET-domain-containing protein [Amniculicola lignicola CBS 123094]